MMKNAQPHGPMDPMVYLSEIYNQKSIDLKSYLGTSKTSVIKIIQNLLEKKLIFPYISLKNLDLKEKVSVIIPDITPIVQKKLLDVFSFFNICFIKGFSKCSEIG
jgi:hypothetical protein